VLTGPGSNFLITLLISALSKRLEGPVMVAAPSFPLYESHCCNEGIPCESWSLDDDLEYSLAKLPSYVPKSLLIFASPNNPVGNVLSSADLRNILRDRPETLVIADEAYVEFSEDPYTSLMSEFSNLILVRTFSKTLSAAGVRLGYVIAGSSMIAELKKLRLPYLLNQFTIVTATEILNNQSLRDFFAQTVQETIVARDRTYQELAKLADGLKVRVKPSHANFFLLRWSTTEEALAVYRHLITCKILVRIVSGAPGMQGCLRVTVGSTHENDALIAALAKFKR
jgi:histidinol-phosphate aminotransferase